MNITTNNNNGNYHHGAESDLWLRAFLANICDRPSCHQCKFRKQYRVSDFTIWDCYVTHKFDKNLDDDKGTTKLLIHSNRGNIIFNQIKNNLLYKSIDSNDLTLGVKEMFQSVENNPQRNQFFEDANNLNGEQLFSKYFPETFRVKAEHNIRILCYKLGIYSSMKKFYNFIKNR